MRTGKGIKVTIQFNASVMSNQLKQNLWIAAAWIAFGLISGTQSVVGMKVEGMEHSWTALFLTQTLSWSFWAIATPAVIFLTRKYPPLQKLSPSGWIAHAVAWVTIGTCHAALGTVLESTLNLWNTDGYNIPWQQTFEGLWLSTLSIDLLVYIGVAAISHGVFAKRELARHELEMARMNSRYFEAQLSGLRRELEPHFLFNTLNGISGLIRDNRNPTAIEMIAKLGDLLRHSLDSRENEVTLSEELDFVRQYLDLQQMRFGARLRVLMTIPDELLPVRVPSLMLQEIVANAIQHGIGKREQGGLISISASHTDESLILSVTNDGPPLSGNVDHLDGADGIGRNGSPGTGLSNIKARLQGLHGTNARFTLQNYPGGVEARVSIPFRLVSI
ncbi:MAG TPA: histidine kinase [Candidatus Angelobacter sp.]|nr:histidine kinase [Candidatus Angelobacter sp.]